MKNITITLDEQTAEWARTAAAARGISLSRFVGEVMRRQLPQAQDYEQAMNRWLARGPCLKVRRVPGESLPTREQIHDRHVLRRR